MCRPNPRVGGYHARAVDPGGFAVPSASQLALLRVALTRAFQCEPAEVGVIEVLVGVPTARRARDGLRVHSCESDLPSGSFVRISIDIDGAECWACAPELVFMQVAGKASDQVEAIGAGMALCSSYRTDRARRWGVATREAPDAPLTSAARLAAYLGRAKGVTGIGTSSAALPFLLDGSRSPRESHFAMIFGLPLRLGGFGLKLHRLNPEVPIPIRSGAHAPDRASLRRPDLHFKACDAQGRVREAFFDYDADLVHAKGGAKAGRDASRRNELATLRGIACFSMTSHQAGDFREIERTAEMIRVALGQRRMPRIVGDPEAPANRQRIEAARSRQFKLWSRLIGIPNARYRAEAAQGAAREPWGT